MARRGFLRRSRAGLSSEWGLWVHWWSYWNMTDCVTSHSNANWTAPASRTIVFIQEPDSLGDGDMVLQSLKSPFAFSHPEVEGSIAATRSTSLVFKLRDLSVQSSNIVARLNKRVCEEKPRSTRPSSVSRPCHRLA
jgi:hypothetical protein